MSWGVFENITGFRVDAQLTGEGMAITAGLGVGQRYGSQFGEEEILHADLSFFARTRSVVTDQLEFRKKPRTQMDQLCFVGNPASAGAAAGFDFGLILSSHRAQRGAVGCWYGGTVTHAVTYA